MISPFPYINNTFDDCPEDGLFFNAPVFCKRNYNQKCITFYKQNSDRKGFHTCPYGFAIYNSEYNSMKITITGLNIKGHSLSKEIQKHEIKNELIPLLLKSDFETMLKKFSLFSGSYIMEKNKNRENIGIINKASFESKLITNTLHELRKLNKQIKTQSEYLRTEIDAIKCKGDNCDRKKLEDRSHNIFSTSQLITTRLNAYDFTVNPTLSESMSKRNIIVFKKFEKAIHCLELTARDKEVRFTLIGRSAFEMKCFMLFELLPFILFENAVKYSPKGKEIKCIFNKDNTIVIMSIGPKPVENELSILFEKGKRSKSAQGYDGSGLGLYLAKTICDFHNIDICIHLGNNIELIDSVEHTDFVVKINLLK